MSLHVSNVHSHGASKLGFLTSPVATLRFWFCLGFHLHQARVLPPENIREITSRQKQTDNQTVPFKWNQISFCFEWGESKHSFHHCPRNEEVLLIFSQILFDTSFSWWVFEIPASVKGMKKPWQLQWNQVLPLYFSAPSKQSTRLILSHFPPKKILLFLGKLIQKLPQTKTSEERFPIPFSYCSSIPIINVYHDFAENQWDGHLGWELCNLTSLPRSLISNLGKSCFFRSQQRYR